MPLFPGTNYAYYHIRSSDSLDLSAISLIFIKHTYSRRPASLSDDIYSVAITTATRMLQWQHCVQAGRTEGVVKLFYGHLVAALRSNPLAFLASSASEPLQHLII